MKYEYVLSEDRFHPIIPIKLKGNTDWIEFKAYIDTGASFCLFHTNVAQILEIDIEKGEKIEMVMGDGDILTAHLHQVFVSIANKEFTAVIAFSKGLGTGFNIIGRKDIFENFIVCFNEKEKWIEFK